MCGLERVEKRIIFLRERVRVHVYVCMRGCMPIVCQDAWETVCHFVYTKNGKWAKEDLHNATLPPLRRCLAYYAIDTQRDVYIHKYHTALLTYTFLPIAI